MCLAIPAKIESITDACGTVALAGSRTRANLTLVPEAKVGDWVLVHAGFAIAVLDEQEARQTYELLAQMDDSGGGDPQRP
jgi:hydrogenase expression/formation protein HypC